MDNFLKTLAGQHARRCLAATYVLVHRDDSDVLGFYSLATTGIRFDEFPQEFAAKLPRYAVLPAILLGRLAVDRSCRNQGLGELLPMDALSRSEQFSSQIAAMAVIVDAIDESAARFYARFEFLPFPRNPLSLFLPMDAVKNLFR